MWGGCGEAHLEKLNSLHQRTGKLILHDPSLSTEQTMSALGILNLPEQLTYSKVVFMHEVLNNTSQTTLHNSSLVTGPTTLTSGITSMRRCQGLTCLKLAYPSLERPSGTPCLKI